MKTKQKRVKKKKKKTPTMLLNENDKGNINIIEPSSDSEDLVETIKKESRKK